MKITITRLLETSKLIATDAGQQLSDMITQTADWMDQGVRALRNGLTFRDNFDQQEKTLSLRTGVKTTVAITRQVTGVLVTRVVSNTYALSTFLWYYDANSRLTVIATFTGSPPDAVDVQAIFLF